MIYTVTCHECAASCAVIGEEPFVIFICENCGQIIDPEKATFVREEEQAEEYWR